MQLPSAIAAGSVAIGLFAAGFAIGHGVDDNSGSKSASEKAQVAGQVFARTPESSTTTTAAPQASLTPATPGAATPTTTAPSNSGGTTATTLQATVTQTSPSTTPSTVVVSGDCGTGTAGASVSAQTGPRDRTANTDYQTDATVAVQNGINKAIEIDTLSIRLTLEDGRVQDVIFTGAKGTVVQSGNTGRYTVSVNTGKTPARSVTLTSFGFHTAGHPECPGRAA